MECHELEIMIRPGGKVEVLVRGAKGAGCLEYARLVQQIFNAQGQVELTSEYYEPPTGVEIHLEQSRG